MKARIQNPRRRGEYLPRKSGELSSAIYMCWCDECTNSGQCVVKPGGDAISGRYFYSEYELRQHFAYEDRGRTHASPEPYPLPTMSLFPQSEAAPETVFDPPNVVSESVSHPLPPTSLNETDDVGTPTPEVPKPTTNIIYEWKTLENIQLHLHTLKENPHRSWIPADIQFRSDLGESPDFKDFTRCLCQDSRNSNFLGHVEWLRNSQMFLDNTLPLKKLSAAFSCKHRVVRTALDVELEDCRHKLEVELIERRQRAATGQESVHLVDIPVGDLESRKSVFFIVLVVAAMLHIICDLSSVPVGFLLGSLRIILKMTDCASQETDMHIPKDIRTVIDRLALNPTYTTYVCCPKCFQLYDIDSCPEFCNNRSAPASSSCNRRLRSSVGSSQDFLRPTNPDRRRPTPVRSYHYQDFKQWIIWMHNRRDIAPHLERPYDPEPPADGKVKDIWQSAYFRAFLGPDGQNLFLSPNGLNESRLVFNLNEDGFNPYGNRMAGKKASVGGIYLVCLNLPPELRLKPENIFLVGVIPGPKEPSAHQINYILRPLVDDLVKLWNDGIFMARTYQHPRGRSVRAALALLVCDMPAARLLGGFAHFSSNADPCSMCKTSDLNNLNSESFIPRTNEEHRRGARAWLAAQSEEERDLLFRRNGVRYSELLRLDYWDPVRNTVVDPMHGFYLRILQRHCRQIWGMNVELVDCEGLWEIKLPTEEGKAAAKEIFDHGTASNLRNLRADSLRYLALQEGLDYRRNKKALADSLLQLRVVRQWQAPGHRDMTRPPQDIPSLDYPLIPPTTSLSMNQSSVDQGPEAGQAPRQRDSSRAAQNNSSPTYLSSSPTASSNNKSSADQEFNAAHQAFLNGQPKTHFKKLSTETIQKLANLYGVHAFTPAGAPSRAKQTLIDALFKWKTESNVDRISMNDTMLLRAGANPALPPLSTHAPIGTGPSAQNDRVQGVSCPSTHQPGEPGRDEHLKLFLNATKSQIDHYPAKVLEGIVQAVKIWKKAAAGPRAHRNQSPGGDLSENQNDDYFETQSNGSLDYEPYDLDNYDEGDDCSDSSEEEVEIVIPSTNKGKRDLIHNIRFESGITSENGQLLNKAATRRSGVLGKDTLAAIREDMEKLQTPSWMAAAPNHPGEASQGKFTADQWRAFCTVNLPITLIRLWGSLPHEERRHEMLVNFMQLITSIRLADMRVMTEERIQTFERHYRAYLTGIIGFEMKDRLGGLYPHTRVTPYQHMMLHFGDLLRLFGPVHSWRCFAFERFNYILQSTKTNSRFGELEKTMFTRFCMMQKLKSLFHGEAFPPMARELATLYQETFEDSDARGTRINDALAYEESNSDTVPNWPVSSLTILDASTYHKVLKISTSEKWATSVRIHGRFKQRGLIFTPQKRSFSDAQVVYHTGTAEEWSAGSIKRIFTTIRESKDGNRVGETFVEIHPYRSLTASHAEYDNYRKFGFAGGRFFYNILEKETLLLPLEKISAHFAYSMQSHSLIDAPIIHALPLNKENEFTI